MEDLQENDELSNFLKTICHTIDILGIEKLWFLENENPLPAWVRPLRRVVSQVLILSVIFSEFAALLFGDLTVRENNYVIQMCIGHTSDYLIVLMVIMKANRIISFLRMFLTQTVVPCDETLSKSASVHCHLRCGALAITMASCIFFANVDDIVNFVNTGVPGGAIVTYWPTRHSKGILAWTIRCISQLYWWYHVFMITFIKYLCLASLLTLAHKFEALRYYFQDIRDVLLKRYDPQDPKQNLIDDYFQMFYKGTILHARLIECAKDLQSSLGIMYNTVVLQSILLLSGCLMKLVVQEFSVIFLLANGLFMLCMTTLIGLFMTAGGDVTHEASFVSDAIVHSGWDVVICDSHVAGARRMRAALVLALQIAQRPVTMTAFGIFDLSYKNFITVLRCSYSFFAVSSYNSG